MTTTATPKRYEASSSAWEFFPIPSFYLWYAEKGVSIRIRPLPLTRAGPVTFGRGRRIDSYSLDNALHRRNHGY